MEPQERLNPGDWLLTRRQRTVAAVLLLLLCALALWRLSRRGPLFHEQAPGPLAAQLQRTLDPNTASADELAVLPGIGPALARRIIAHRQQHAATQPARPAFLTPADLDTISGIGPATLERLTPHLRFPQ